MVKVGEGKLGVVRGEGGVDRGVAKLCRIRIKSHLVGAAGGEQHMSMAPGSTKPPEKIIRGPGRLPKWESTRGTLNIGHPFGAGAGHPPHTTTQPSF